MFTYLEGDEASYFVISEDSEGDAADVGPSGVGALKESLRTSSSRGWVTEPSVSKGEPDILAMEAVRTDEILPEIASGASPATTKVSSMEPTGVSVAIEGVPRDTVVETVEAVSLMTSSLLGNTLTICKQSFLDIIIPCFNEVLLQVFHPWVHRLRGNQ